MRTIKHWAELEDAIEEILSELQKKKKLAYLRLYDTKSAGDYLPQQPADFLITYSGFTTLLEAKFSEVHDSLAQCFSNAAKPNQTASAHIWSRAGAKYFFLFYPKLSNGKVELWDGAYCAHCRANGRRLDRNRRQVRDSVEEAIKTAISLA